MKKNNKFMGWTWKNVGERAKKLKVCLGKVACPHCGSLQSGVISNTCAWCQLDMFEPLEQMIYTTTSTNKELRRNPLDRMEKEVNEGKKIKTTKKRIRISKEKNEITYRKTRGS